MSDDRDFALGKMLELIDDMELSEYAYDLIDPDDENSYSSIELLPESRIAKRDILISSLRQQLREYQTIQSINKDGNCTEKIKEIKAFYEKMLEDKTNAYLDDKHKAEEKYMTEISRLQKLINEHRELIRFENLPSLTKSEVKHIASCPESSIQLPQFISFQLYNYQRDVRKKLKQMLKINAEFQINQKRIENEKKFLKEQLASEKKIRMNLEEQLMAFSKKSPPKPIPLPEFELQGKVELLEKELNDMSSAYHSSVSQCDTLLNRIKILENQNEQLQNESIMAKKEIGSLKNQLASAQAECLTQEELLEHRDKELMDIRSRFNTILQKTLHAD